MPLKKRGGTQSVANYFRRCEAAIAGGYRTNRRAIARKTPAWLKRRLMVLAEHFDLYCVDHGIVRSIYSNTHQVTPYLWRSSQPAPYQIRRMAGKGIRTVINMRGERDCGSYRLEAAACARHGLTLVNFPLLRSRMAPEAEAIRDLQQILEDIEYPALVHCKSGADRAGLFCALTLIFREGAPVEQAIGQLGLRYGHIKQARTGILDHFFERYIAYNREIPTPFLTWLDSVYDRQELRRSFRAQSWANVAVDWILRRE